MAGGAISERAPAELRSAAKVERRRIRRIWFGIRLRADMGPRLLFGIAAAGTAGRSGPIYRPVDLSEDPKLTDNIFVGDIIRHVLEHAKRRLARTQRCLLLLHMTILRDADLSVPHSHSPGG